MRAPSSTTSSCSELAPRTKTLVRLPSGPLRAIETPGRRLSTRVTSGPWIEAISRASTTLTDWPVSEMNAFDPVATTMIEVSRAPSTGASAASSAKAGDDAATRAKAEMEIVRRFMTRSLKHEACRSWREPARIRRSALPSGTPRPALNDCLGQVSWLPDRRFPPAFPATGPVAYGRIAPRSQLRGQRGNSIRFPLRPGIAGTHDTAGPIAPAAMQHKQPGDIGQQTLQGCHSGMTETGLACAAATQAPRPSEILTR